MFVERNPFSKDINDQIADIMESHTVSLKAEAEIEERKETKRPLAIWQEHLTSSILDEMIADGREVSICESGRLYKFNRLEVPNYVSKLQPFIRELFPDMKVKPSGGFYYPPGGFMGWHNNCNSPNLRFYITYASHENKSFFRYLNEKGEIVNDYDDKGITLRLFDIPKEPPHFWHCVGSDCDRFSVGVKLIDD
jgi:hypothetical protein